MRLIAWWRIRARSWYKACSTAEIEGFCIRVTAERKTETGSDECRARTASAMAGSSLERRPGARRCRRPIRERRRSSVILGNAIQGLSQKGICPTTYDSKTGGFSPASKGPTSVAVPPNQS